MKRCSWSKNDVKEKLSSQRQRRNDKKQHEDDVDDKEQGESMNYFDNLLRFVGK